MSDNVEQVTIFKGSDNIYANIATKGSQTLGLSLVYALHPLAKTGALIVRFVVHSKEGIGAIGKFKFFKRRENAPFKTIPGGENFSGVRLNKLAIPIFHPGTSLHKFLQLCEKFQIWEILSDWVIERCQADGFTVTQPGELGSIMAKLVSGDINSNDDDEVKLVIEFPNFGDAIEPVSFPSSIAGVSEGESGEDEEDEIDEEEKEEGEEE